jgi:hypothetical protein
MKNSILWDVAVAFVGTDVPSKRLFLHEPHGIISQKTAFILINSGGDKSGKYDMCSKFVILC